MARIVTILLLMFVIAGCPITQKSAARKPAVRVSPDVELRGKLDKKFEDPEAHYQLGKLAHSRRQFDKAIFEYHTALGFNPMHYRAQAGIVKATMDQKKPDQANTIAELYISQAAFSAPRSLQLGRVFEKEGLDNHALGCYYQAAGLAPKSSEPYKMLGHYYMAKGDKVRAEENLRRSFELNPNQPDVSSELGRLGVHIQGPHDTQPPR